MRWDCVVIGGVAGIFLGFGLATCVQAAEKKPPKMQLCTGGDSGNYYFAGTAIAAQAKGNLEIEILTSGGSVKNLERVEAGECDAGMVQNDALQWFQSKYPGSTLKLERAGALYDEMAHLLCNKKAGVGKISNLTNKHRVAVGAAGSGAAVTWDGFVSVDKKRYQPVPTDPLGGERALAKVADGDDLTCMLWVGSLGSGFMKNTASAYKDRIELVATDDRDMKDAKDPKGRQLYSYVTIPGSSYPLNSCMMGCGVDTIAVKALLVVNTKWVDENPGPYDKLLEAVRKAMPSIREKVGQK